MFCSRLEFSEAPFLRGSALKYRLLMLVSISEVGLVRAVKLSDLRRTEDRALSGS